MKKKLKHHRNYHHPAKPSSSAGAALTWQQRLNLSIMNHDDDINLDLDVNVNVNDNANANANDNVSDNDNYNVDNSENVCDHIITDDKENYAAGLNEFAANADMKQEFMCMEKRLLISTLNSLFLDEVKVNLIERAHEFTDCAYTKHEHREDILILLQCVRFQLNKLVKILYKCVSK